MAADWEELLPPKGFQVLPKRWVVERTFSWLSQNRRMSKEYERLPETSEAFIYVAITRLMARRLARSRGFSRTVSEGVFLEVHHCSGLPSVGSDLLLYRLSNRSIGEA